MAEIIFLRILSCIISIFVLNTNALPAERFYPALPTKPDHSFDDALFSDNGDLSPALCTVNSSNTDFILHSGINGEKYRWRNGFNVQPDPKFNQGEVNLINAAMYELSQKVCIRFGIWPQNSRPSGDYVFINKNLGSGCWSNVGRLGGKQQLNLDPGCMHKRIIMHELIHSLGFWHEQSRPDRDNFVNIHWENVETSKHWIFRKESDSLTFGVPYDYNSIMHYGPNDFSKNGKAVITAKKPGQSVGPTEQLTSKDIQKLRKMYNC